MKDSLVSTSEQREFWESVEERRDPFHPAVRAFAKPKVDLAAEKIRLPDKAVLLEVGCGNGFFTVYLKEHWKVIALDRSRRMLMLNPYRKSVQGDAGNLPFGNASCDIVFSTNLLHHIDDPLMAVGEMARVSRRYVVLVEPNRNNPFMFLFSAIKKEERGAVKFSLGYLTSLAERAGLRPIYSCSHGSVVPNKTPESLVPWLSPFNGEIPMGFYIMVIAEIISGDTI